MYSATIEIAASPSQVFAVLTDPGLLKQWTPEIADAEVKPPEGGLRVGAIAQASVKEFGRRFSVELVVLALEPAARLAYRMTTPMWSGRIDYVLTRRNGGTDLSLLFVPDQPKGGARLIMRALAVLTRPLVQRRLRSRLAALRRVVEATHRIDS
jgi:uncharacterized protein YndB with AHSA1/START domain